MFLLASSFETLKSQNGWIWSPTLRVLQQMVHPCTPCFCFFFSALIHTTIPDRRLSRCETTNWRIVRSCPFLVLRGISSGRALSNEFMLFVWNVCQRDLYAYKVTQLRTADLLRRHFDRSFETRLAITHQPLQEFKAKDVLAKSGTASNNLVTAFTKPSSLLGSSNSNLQLLVLPTT